jgi:hypothetical protein
VSPDYTETDLDAAQEKPRPRGVLPYLPKQREPVSLAAWLTLATRPIEQGFRLAAFERLGRDPRDPCVLVFGNGREGARRFRIKSQRDLMRNPRTTLLSVADGWLDVPHLTAGEIEDVWAALCRFGAVLSEHDEVEQTREWVEAFLPATLALNGYSLVPDMRHDALMAIRRAGTFTKGDALALVRPGDAGDMRFAQRPTRFVDSSTGEQWIRAGETATYLRYVIGVEPLPHGTLRARLREIGIVGRYFEDYRPPHPKLALYQLTDELIEQVDPERVESVGSAQGRLV